MVKKTTPAVSVRTLAAGVVLPASTGDGVQSETSVKDVLKLGENQNDDAAGDLAADIVTRPVAAIGAIVEPASPGLGEHPNLNANAAGDAAALEVAGADPLVIVNTAEGFAAAPISAAVPLDTETGQSRPTASIRLGPGADIFPEYVIFDLTRPATDEERANLQVVLKHLEVSVPTSHRRTAPNATMLLEAGQPGFSIEFPLTSALLEDWRGSDDRDYPLLRVTSKVAGFRRGGFAHPAAAVDHRIWDLRPWQVEAILSEPQLVTELV